MKSKEIVVQTTLSPEEHTVLLDYATKQGISIKEAVKRAIPNLIQDDTVISDDPYFNFVVKSNIKEDKSSEQVDKILYQK